MYGVIHGVCPACRGVGDGHFAVVEGGVAQPFAERECRILREIGIAVAVLTANLVVIHRQLPGVAREGDGKPAAGIGEAEDDFGDRLPAFHSRAWRPQERADAVCRGFVHDDAVAADHACGHDLRLGAHQHDDQRCAGFACHIAERFEHGVLAAEQFQGCGRAGFSDQLHDVADDSDDEVALAGVIHGFVEHPLVDGGADGEFRARLAVREVCAFRVIDQVDDVRAAAVGDVAALWDELFESVEDCGDHAARLAVGHPGDLAGVARPVAQLVLGVVGKRADDGDAFAGGGERQRPVVIQQDCGFTGDAQIEMLMGVAADDFFDAPFIGQSGVFEQAETELEREDAAHCGVDQRFVQQAGVHGFDGAVVELRCGHDQVVAGFDCVCCGLHIIGFDLLLPHCAADVVPVGDQRALVVPVTAQLIGEQPVVECDRYAVDGLVAEHEGAAAFFGDPFERRKEP